LAYIALYRQWRPQSFDAVVGQDHISRTLKNAIKTNRIVHAYLFTGPRGTGKTSTAKILAKAVNCLEPKDGEACNHCSSCTRINSGTYMDIVEIDAASNRGIDEIRDLREKVKYAPVEGKYKIYIIDEVHMLTTEAFNALLKTLEEPPKHVIFILATTEPYKIPLTVLSRCQQFDFKRIGTRYIVEKLKEICAEESLPVNENALQIIAKKAEGSMRDALSLLDQCLSFSENEITEEILASILGTVDRDFIKNIVQALNEKDYGTMITMIDSLIQEGKDIRLFAHDLVEYLRNLILVKISSQSAHKLDLPDNLLRILLAQSKMFSTDALFQILEVLSEGESQLKFSTQPRITLELSLIKAAGIAGKGEKGFAEPQALIKKQPGQKTAASAAKKEVVSPEAEEAEKEDQVTEPKGAEPSIDLIKSCWKNVLALVKKSNRSTHAYLMEGEPVELKDREIILLFHPQMKIHMEKIGEPANKSLIEKVLLEVFKHKLTVQGTMAYTPDEGDKLLAEVKEMFGDVDMEIIE
jgi:DNA polymerase-3 subunit gamma/tau